MDGQKQTYEQFKADILQWKDSHREEYRRFAKMMADGNEMQYLAVCRAIFKQLPGIRREWQQSWCDDSIFNNAYCDQNAIRNVVWHEEPFYDSKEDHGYYTFDIVMTVDGEEITQSYWLVEKQKEYLISGKL